MFRPEPGASGRLSVNTEGFSLRRIVIPSKHSQCLPVNAQRNEAFSKRENGQSRSLFAFKGAQKALFSSTSMMTTVLKDTALQYFNI